MTISAHPTAAPAAAVARARVEVEGLHERLWAAVGDSELLDVVAEIAGLRSVLAAIEARVLAEVDQREVPRKRLQWGSSTDWLAHTAGVTRGVAKRTLRHAHDLVRDRQETLGALRAGVVSPAQAGVICDGVDALPGDRMLRRRAEQTLLGQATHLDATDLGKAARRVLDLVDPDHDDRKTEAALAREERAAHAGRGLSIREDGAGGVWVKGRGTVEDAATLRAALLPLTKPEPSVDPVTGAETERDPRDHGARMWDALIRLGQHALDAELPPASHGAKPRVSVTIRIEDLLTGLGRHPWGAETDDGLHLHPAVVRRMACDAEIIPVVLGTDGQVLDVGRTYRTATEAIWRAVVARDHHCAFPGCRRPPLMCHAHHIVHWADGGDTSLGNLVLLCGEHHRTIHHTPWRVRLGPHDGLPEFLPPPRHRTFTSATTDTTTDPETDAPVWIRHRARHRPQLE